MTGERVRTHYVAVGAYWNLLGLYISLLSGKGYMRNTIFVNRIFALMQFLVPVFHYLDVDILSYLSLVYWGVCFQILIQTSVNQHKNFVLLF